MITILDRIAYRLFVAHKPVELQWTPEIHYDIRRRMLEKYGYTMSDNLRPYWWSVVRSRLENIYWLLHP